MFRVNFNSQKIEVGNFEKEKRGAQISTRGIKEN
jgi:hypothetical protein